jgi:hypothetical protein
MHSNTTPVLFLPQGQGAIGGGRKPAMEVSRLQASQRFGMVWVGQELSITLTKEVPFAALLFSLYIETLTLVWVWH